MISLVYLLFLWKIMKLKVIRVAVLGAGASGLCALRHLASKQSRKNPIVHFNVVAFEQSSRVGGTWVYTDQIGNDEWGQPIHSSMYKNLRTNLPKECMAFPDYAFPSNLPSFIGHADVENYLEAYTTHFDLWKYIKFQRHVKHVKPVFNKEGLFGTQWEVTTSDVKTDGDIQNDIFDAVLVCNGHHSKPHYPKIIGLDRFQGHIIHSHDYREPSGYKDKTVIVLGAQSSGQDIAVEVASVAKQVYLCHNKERLVTVLPSNVEQKPGIKHCHPHVLEFHDGSALEVDSIILCTGYHYCYDFLSSDVDVKIEDNRITPLYKHLLHCRFPNLGFIGIPKSICPFPLFDVQVRLFRSVLDGSCILPSEEGMIADAEEDYQLRRKQGLPHRYCHTLADRQFEYNNTLAKMARTELLPDIIERVYKATHVLRRADILHYRDNNFILHKDGKFEILEEGRDR